METDDDELAPAERQALDAWTPLSPPAGFAERVLAARAEVPVPARSRRWPFVAGGILVLAGAAAIVAIVTWPEDHSAAGSLVASARTTARLGDRAVAVAEPGAALTWSIDSEGAARIEQRDGDVFYRVDRGGAFVVDTPAGSVRVTGTCFRIEVEPMTNKKQVLLSGAVSAALAAGVVVTVYEGNVVAETRTGRTELVAGTRATLDGNGTSVAARDASPSSGSAGVPVLSDLSRASREELIARATSQQQEIRRLRQQLEAASTVSRPEDMGEASDPGRAWHDPSPETLEAWAKKCQVRGDEFGVDGWKPLTSLGRNSRGLEPDELDAYNASLSEVQDRFRKLVRALYIEATGDTAGSETLSIDAMRSEILEKSPPGEHNLVIQRISAERAGLAQPPADLSQTSPVERLMRAYLQLGDQTEAELAKRLGPERAAAIRGDAWDSRSTWSGCPETQP